ncbi:MAG: radical SAM protein [Longimicrobiales bacterium]
MSGSSTPAKDSVRVTEIFHSIQGESTWAGLPCTFVRLTGCPLRCAWCDTAYAFHGGTRMTLDAVLAEVRSKGCGLVEITGGEPLVQPGAFALADRLLDEGYTVLVETSGALDVSGLDARVHKIMDLKCPGSGEEERNLWSNLEYLTARDEVNFVVADEDDLEWAMEAVRSRKLDERVLSGALNALLVSPVWGAEDLPGLSAKILESGLPIRVQTQLHKHIWSPDAKGV